MSGTRSRNKGARYERAVADYLRTRLGIQAARRLEQYQTGGDDLAHDLDGWLSIECKDVAATSIGAWLDQAVRQAGGRVAAVIHHRRGNGQIAGDFVTLTVADFARLVELADQTVAPNRCQAVDL